MVQGCAG